MKKIIMSLGMIVFAGALIAGGTGAFFSDTETSTGNVFTAGAIDLKVDAQAHYAGLICTSGEWVIEDIQEGTTRPDLVGDACDGTWEQTDLGITHKFFNIGDIKPGDEGENTISLHVDNNDAWMCADVAITSNDDVSTVEPELGAGDTANDDSITDGELAQNLEFVAWNDSSTAPDTIDGDNIHQPGEELFFAPGPASTVLAGGTLTIADGGTGTPLPGGSTSYIGLAWCAGTMTATTDGGAPTCDGATMGNVAQTDSMTADITFRVEQSRNNDAFRCEREEEEVLPATVTVDKIVTFTSTSIDGVDVTDFALTLDGPVAGTGDAILVVDQIATPGLVAGTYTVSEVYSGAPAGITYDATFSGACSEIGDTNVGTMNVVAGSNVTCTITNSVSPVVVIEEQN